MGYLDTTDAEMFALTRQRRQQACERRDAARQAHEALQFPFVPQTQQDQIEAAWREVEQDFGIQLPHLIWKREQWAAGNRRCGYCGQGMTRQPNHPRTCTVDHRKPRALGGKDVEENWLMACNECNQRKGMMSESMFRAPLRADAARNLGRLTA